MKKSVVLLTIAIAMTLSVLAQAPMPKPEEPVTRVYEIKWRDSVEIAEVLVGIGHVRTGRTFNTIIVTAHEREQAVVRELIQKFDVPAKTVEFQFHVLKASRAGQGLKNGVPEKISKILRGISSLTKYQSYELLDVPNLRVQEGKEARISGQAQYPYSIHFEGVRISRDPAVRQQIIIDKFAINFSVMTMVGNEGGVRVPRLHEVGISTSFNMADGETIVVGASQIKPSETDPDEAIITVVTATILK